MKCKKCPVNCANIENYIRHSKSHGNIIPCCNCNLAFTGRTQFFDHFKCHKEKTIVSQQRLTAPLRCSHCSENFTSYEDFKNHVKKLYPQTKIDCPSCGKRNICTFGAFRLHYFRDHKQNLAKNQSPDLMNDIDFSSETGHDESFDYSGDEEMPMSIEDPDDTTLNEEREKMKVQFLAKIMLIAGSHGVPQGIIFKLHRLLFTVESSNLT